jgi:hypothetical protein
MYDEFMWSWWSCGRISVFNLIFGYNTFKPLLFTKNVLFSLNICVYCFFDIFDVILDKYALLILLLVLIYCMYIGQFDRGQSVLLIYWLSCTYLKNQRTNPNAPPLICFVSGSFQWESSTDWVFLCIFFMFLCFLYCGHKQIFLVFW